MIALCLIVAMQANPADPADSVYSSPYVRALVERASVSNRRIPDSLRTYRANVETEMAFIARQPDGVEQTFTVEQTASVVHWSRSGAYEQRVVGYRSQSVGLTTSPMGFFHQAWTVPVLYGNTLTLLFGQQDSVRRSAARRRNRDTVVAVHPFALDRETLYRFSGGDTVFTIDPGGRTIPVVRVHVEPHGEQLKRETTAFQGDIELDERRAQIIRMRGAFVTVGPRRRVRFHWIASQLDAIALVELVNGEYDEHYWLPAYQRVEAQAAFSLLGNQRAVFRVVSRFRSMTVNSPDSRDEATADSLGMVSDSLRSLAHRLTFAPPDSMDRFNQWARGIGEQIGDAHADDFIDLAPDVWRPTGRPSLRVRFEQPSDLVHYNRIEGAYTGIGAEAALRDAAPGVIARTNVGWAWTEGTARGRLSVERQAGRWWPRLRVGRSLDITNDFREPFDSGSTIGALVSVDDYDYVDRRSAILGLTWFANRHKDLRLRLEGGIASDHYVAAHQTRGPLAAGDSGFRFNRGVDEGRYRLAAATLEWHPDIHAAFVRSGIGAVLHAEAAHGDIAWQRTEIRLVARRALGPFIYVGRADGGVVSGDSIPPQQLFELGDSQNLPGYGYKEFAGNQAAVLGGLVMYPLPLWRSPLRIRRFVLPSPAPIISFGTQGGWASATKGAARASILRLGAVTDSVLERPGGLAGPPVSRPTNGFKSSIDLRLRFFGGAISVGVARATDHHDRWRFVAGFAQVI